MAQLSRLVKSSILTLNISNFGIVYLIRYISKICEKRFRFIGTLMSVVILITYASSTIMIGNHKPRSQGFSFGEAKGLTFMPYAKFIKPKFFRCKLIA